LGDTARSLVSLYVPTIVVSVGLGMVVPVTPLVAAEFGVSLGTAAQMVTAQALAGLVFLIPAGILADRMGRRFALVVGPLLMATAALATAVTPSFWLILPAQLLGGAGSQLWQIGRELAAMDVVRAEQRGRVLSGFFGLNSVGMVLGPVVGGVVADHFGYRGVFGLYGVLALAILPVALMVGNGPSRPPASVRGLDIGWGRIAEIAPEFRVTFGVLFIATFAAFLRGAVFNSIFPLYVGGALGRSSTEVGFLFSVVGVVTLLMLAPAGLVSDKLGRKVASGSAAALATVAFMLYPLATSMEALVAVSLINGVASAFGQGSMTTYSYDIVPVAARGQMQALRRTFGQIGMLLGPGAGGALADRVGPGPVFWYAAPIQLAATLLLVFVARESLPRKRAEAAEGG
jgi:MFS family permease